jgi:hypothetical protein
MSFTSIKQYLLINDFWPTHILLGVLVGFFRLAILIFKVLFILAVASFFD